MLELARPYLLILIVLPLFARLFLPAAKMGGHSLFFPRYGQVLDALGLKGRRRSEGVKTSFWMQLYKFIVFGLIVLAAAGPQRLGSPETVLKSSRSFLIVTDISTSMNERDWPSAEGGTVSRWEGVSSFLEGFIGRREGDTMALIAFASQGYIQAPFTNDLELVQTLLNELEVGMAGQKTALGNAISVGIEVFDKEELPQKVMLLITDGVDSGSDIPPLDAAAIAAGEDIRIYTLGIGQKASRSYDLDEDSLIAIAEKTGGAYFKADDPASLDNVSEQLDLFEPKEYELELYKPVDPLYHSVLALVLILILIPFLLDVLLKLLFFRRRENR